MIPGQKGRLELNSFAKKHSQMEVDNKIRVGIIGVGTERGWANLSHVPAIKALQNYEIVAISTRNKEKTSLLKESSGILNVYETPNELIEDQNVDLVVVSVRVPLHYGLIKQAVLAGKDVLSEWPLGKNIAEAEELATIAKIRGVKAYVMLQSRAVPAVRYIKDLIDKGRIGSVLSTSLIGSGIIYGENVNKANDYTADPINGAGMINVTFGNAVDAVTHVLGEFTELSATTAIRRKSVDVIETGENIANGTADQVAVTGLLKGGIVASIHFRGGTFPGTNLLWEINGTKGDIQVTAPGGSLAVFDLTVKVSSSQTNALEIVEIPQQYYLAAGSGLGNIPSNVGQIYQLIAEGKAPTFEDALVRHRMIDAIERSARTGYRQTFERSND